MLKKATISAFVLGSLFLASCTKSYTCTTTTTEYLEIGPAPFYDVTILDVPKTSSSVMIYDNLSAAEAAEIQNTGSYTSLDDQARPVKDVSVVCN